MKNLIGAIGVMILFLGSCNSEIECTNDSAGDGLCQQEVGPTSFCTGNQTCEEVIECSDDGVCRTELGDFAFCNGNGVCDFAQF